MQLKMHKILQNILFVVGRHICRFIVIMTNFKNHILNLFPVYK